MNAIGVAGLALIAIALGACTTHAGAPAPEAVARAGEDNLTHEFARFRRAQVPRDGERPGPARHSVRPA
jgi:hypothetical protein